ncbi:MAG: DUF547 domain-containing protein [Saprospiraceae bacterium]
MKTLFNFLIATFLILGNNFAQTNYQQFFQNTDAFLKTHVQDGLINYAAVKNDMRLKTLIETVETIDLREASDATKKAFYINAYNLHVVNASVATYPIQSVQNIPGFFDRKKVKIAGAIYTLTSFEKERLLTPYKDARLHFVLVCGALGCPPITDFAYTSENLDQQLTEQTKLALNNPDFLKITQNNLNLSQIFNWYPEDFGGNKKGIIRFINKYRTYTVPTTAKISYYPYDWTLNDASAGSAATTVNNSGGGNNTTRYIVSSTIPKGSFEVKIFNNLYTQKTGSPDNLTNRSTFFTTSISVLYGLTNRFNIGINTRYRRTSNERLPSSALDVFGAAPLDGSARQGFTAFGPQIRYAPVEKWENFSIQSSFVYPIGRDLAGSATQPYIDWTGPTWNTQFFNDLPLGKNFSLFTEIDVLLEDIGSSSSGHINRFSTPATLILSYNPNKKTTIYTIGGFSPYWQSTFDYFLQGGVGAKYQFTPNLELELLVTDFTNKFLSDTGGQASTFNVGFRFNL